MRVLVLGGTGMLGHKLHELLSVDHDVVSTTRRPLASFAVDPAPFLSRGRVIEGIDAADPAGLDGLIDQLAPDAVVNCIGVVKQREAAHDPIPSIAVNALLPHLLARSCADRGVRLIHFSTDCVFSGARGGYTEYDVSDATDLYGRTKFLGEVDGERVLTIRSSIIGRELDHFASLVEWFLAQAGTVPGFTRALYSGLTTMQMAHTVRALLDEHPDLDGLYQVASATISKYHLLALIRDACGLRDRIDLVPDDSLSLDRSLVGDRFTDATGIRVPAWETMIGELAEDAARYGRVTR